MSALTRSRPNKSHKGIVFVVDDDEDLLNVVQTLLEKNGYLVLAARNGVEALSRMRGLEWGPMVAVIDLMMPDMTGWELVAAMKADAKLADIPIVVCTALKGQAVDGVDALIKPVRPQVLLEAVRLSLAQ